MFVTNSAQIREIDRIMIEEYDYPGLLLMENAGRKSAELILGIYPNIQNFLVLCGAGNNGGDGLVTARYLMQAKRNVRILLAYPPETMEGDALINFQIIVKQGLKFDVYSPEIESDITKFLHSGAIVIDALLGTGLRQKIREPITPLIKFIQQMPNSVVGIDLPSGLFGDTGSLVNVPLKCEHTITFQLPKICHYVFPAANYCGKVHIADIHIYDNILDRLGIKTQVITDKLVAGWHLMRNRETHKGSYGHVLAAGGSRGKGGAIALCTQAAIDIGAGLCTAFIPGGVACSFHRTTLENMSIPYGSTTLAYLNETAAEVFSTYLEGKAAVAIGPGLGNNQDTIAFFKEVLPRIQVPVVLDADALNIIAENPDMWKHLPTDSRSNVIITPHPGEMARLMGTTIDVIQERRFESAIKLAMDRNVLVVLKGAGTIVAAPNGAVFLSPIGNPGMASAGTGDVLTGIITGLIAQGYNALKAAAMGVYIHARSADLVMRTFGHEGVTASKIIRYLGAALKEIASTPV